MNEHTIERVSVMKLKFDDEKIIEAARRKAAATHERIEKDDDFEKKLARKVRSFIYQNSDE